MLAYSRETEVEAGEYNEEFRGISYSIETDVGERLAGVNERNDEPRGRSAWLRCGGSGCNHMSQRYGHRVGTSFESEEAALEWARDLIERHIDRRH